MHSIAIEIRSAADMVPVLAEFEQQIDAAEARVYHDFDAPSTDAVTPALSPLDHRILCLPDTHSTEQPDSYQVEAALPGFRPHEVKVTVGPQDMVIRAESLKNGKDFSRPRMCLRAVCHFRFRHAVDLDRITARLKAGILRIVVRKQNPARKSPDKQSSAVEAEKHAIAAV